MTALRRHPAGAALLALALGGGVRPAPAQSPPGHEIDQQQVCLGCHELEGLAAKVQHAPVAGGECSACHNPHVARYKALLRKRPGPLCATCHEDLTAALRRKVVHTPAAKGECASCHKPHGSAFQGLLVAPSAQLCAGCHSEIEGWKERRVQHAPFAEGRCASCHDPHSSDRAGLLTRGGASLCSSCHRVDAALRAKHNGYPVDKAACQQCHEPHASARRGLFRESLHAPFEAGDCTSCHRAAGAAEPFALVKPVAELCGDCHEDAVEVSRKAPFPHISAGGGACTACHNPHTGDGSALLRREPQALCLDCHDPGGSHAGGKGRFVTHGGFECTKCHAPHGGERPLFFRQDSVELCGGCHTHEHSVVHPLGEKTRDPRTGNPMTCRSCHGLHRADGEMYTFEADLRMMCVGWHKDLRGR